MIPCMWGGPEIYLNCSYMANAHRVQSLLSGSRSTAERTVGGGDASTGGATSPPPTDRRGFVESMVGATILYNLGFN